MKNKSKIYNNILTKDLLKELYINQNKTIKQISNMCDCCYDSVRNRLIKYNIKIRTVAEARKLINVSGKNSGMYKTGKYCNNNNVYEGIFTKKRHSHSPSVILIDVLLNF